MSGLDAIVGATDRRTLSTPAFGPPGCPPPTGRRLSSRALLALRRARAHTSFGDARMKAVENLPGQLTTFVGREAISATVRRCLQADRLVSLVGPGGCGKTRLAIETGRRVADLRPDGVFFVDVSGLSDPGLVPGAVLGALGLRVASGRDPVDTLVAQLSERHVLLLLDNCEHLVDACASLTDALMPRLPHGLGPRHFARTSGGNR